MDSLPVLLRDGIIVIVKLQQLAGAFRLNLVERTLERNALTPHFRW